MRSLWLSCVCFAIVATSLPGAPPEQPQPAAVLSDELRHMLSRLDAQDVAERHRAERSLFDQGLMAIPALESAALEGNVGVIPSALRVLERMLIEGCPDLADEAERALERLAFSERPETLSRAREVLSGNYHLRQRRAVAAIRELDGRVVFEPLDGSQGGNVMWAWGGDPRLEIPGQRFARMNVYLLRGWQGGEEGLWHVTRLEDAWSARLWGMDVMTIRGSGLPIESVQALAARIPHVQIHDRGGSLGVSSSAVGECRINQVIPGGAAHKAGLQSGDIVVQLEDVPIANFNDLVGNLLDYNPEDKVTLKIKRGGTELDVPVELGNWSDLNVANRNRLPPPTPPPSFNER